MVVGPNPVPGPPAVAGPVVVAPRGALIAGYYCLDGSRIDVTYNGQRQTVVVSEPGAPQLLLHWIPGRGGERYVAGPSRLVVRGGEVRFSRYGGPTRVCTAR